MYVNVVFGTAGYLMIPSPACVLRSTQQRRGNNAALLATLHLSISR